MNGVYFYSDYAGGMVEWLKLGGDQNSVVASGDLRAANTPAIDPVWIDNGLDGHIYYLTYGYVGASELHRLRYVGSGDRPPIISTAAVTTPYGPSPFTATFSGSATDGDGDPILYHWDFGDGTSAAIANPTHVYSDDGTYRARLTVTSLGQQATSPAIVITVGDPPTATITSPGNDSRFVGGDQVVVTGAGVAADGWEIPPSLMSWTVTFRHAEHSHPTGIVDQGGSSITLDIGTDVASLEAHAFEGDDTWYDVALTVMDWRGLTSTSTITLRPTIRPVSFGANVPAGSVAVDGIWHNLPFAYGALVGFNSHVSVQAAACANGRQWNFASWSDGSTAVSRAFAVGSAGTSLQARYVDSGTVGGCPSGNVLVPTPPVRVLETRVPDGQIGYAGARPTAGQTVAVRVAGSNGVPADATAVALNITGTDPSADGFVTVFPCGTPRPNASNLNLASALTSSNAVLARVGVNGEVCIYTQSGADLVADLNGYVPATSSYQPTQPERVLETRDEIGQIGYSGARPGVGQTIELQIPSVPTGADTVVLNITGTDVTASGFVTVYPCGVDRPNASSLNLSPGVTSPNLVFAKIGFGAKVCLFTQSGAELIADLNGFVASGSQYKSVTPTRLLETRPSGQIGYRGSKPLAGDLIELQVAGNGNVPASATTAVLNVTGTDPTASGFVTVYPCGTPRPLASNLNVASGRTTPNLVVAQIGAAGKVCLFVQNPTDLVVDLNGYL